MSARVPPPESRPINWLTDLLMDPAKLSQRIDEDLLRFEARMGANRHDTASAAQHDALLEAKSSLEKLTSLSPSDLAMIEFKREGIQIQAAITGKLKPEEIYAASGALTELLIAEHTGVTDHQLGKLIGVLATQTLSAHRTPQIQPLVEERSERFDLFVHSIQGLEALGSAAAMRNEYVRADRSIFAHQRRKLGLPPETTEIPRGIEAARSLLEHAAPVIVDAILTSNDDARRDIARIERAMKESPPDLFGKDPSAYDELAKWSELLPEWSKNLALGGADLSGFFGQALQKGDLRMISRALGKAIDLTVARFHIEEASADIPDVLRGKADGVTIAHRFDLLVHECESAELASNAVKSARALFDTGKKKEAKAKLLEVHGTLNQLSVMHRQAYAEISYRLDRLLELFGPATH